jgi:hypothetical protein
MIYKRSKGANTMKIKTRQDYIESLRKLKLNLWMFGERVASPVDHPIIIPSMNAVSFTYELALDAQHEDLMTATSHLTGKKNQQVHPCFSQHRRSGQESPSPASAGTENGVLFSALCRHGCVQFRLQHLF